MGPTPGGLFYASNGDETSECVVHTIPGFFEDCLILADDFRQYYLGGFSRTDNENPASVVGPDEYELWAQTAARGAIIGLTIAAGSLVLVHNLYGQAAPVSRAAIWTAMLALAGAEALR